MFFYLLAAFTLIPALEFYLLFRVGSLIGAGNTFAIIIVTGIVGAGLARAQGMAIIHTIRQELVQGKVPGKQIVHGFLVFGGGLLLLTPGFFTDFSGLCMVAPGPRHMLVEILIKFIERGIANGTIQFAQMSGDGFYQQYRQDEPPYSTREDSNIIDVDFKKKGTSYDGNESD